VDHFGKRTPIPDACHQYTAGFALYLLSEFWRSFSARKSVSSTQSPPLWTRHFFARPADQRNQRFEESQHVEQNKQ